MNKIMKSGRVQLDHPLKHTASSFSVILIRDYDGFVQVIAEERVAMIEIAAGEDRSIFQPTIHTC